MPCLTLSNIRYVSRVKWSNPGKGVAPSPTPRCSSYWKGNLWVTLDYSHQLYLLYTFNYSFLSFRVFGLLSSSLLLYLQHFGWNVLRPSSEVCRTREPIQNFEPRPEEGRRTHRPKRCEYNNKDDDNSPKTLNDKNHLALSQKLGQLLAIPIS